jgi:hypothetical protein
MERPADYSRAPPPRKLDSQPSGGSVLVLGDSMADWLAYGLEDALGDPPDLAVVRKNRATAGLIRYDSRNENQDWAQVIREAIAASKPAFIVMMVGLNDRIDIRDRISGPAKGAAATPAKEPPAKPSETAKSDSQDAEQSPGEQAAPAAPEPPQKGGTTTTTYRLHDFRTDEWVALYTKRIDATIAALKSAGVPVFWPAGAARHEVDRRHAVSQRPLSRPRGKGLGQLHRRVGRLCRRERPLQCAGPRL